MGLGLGHTNAGLAPNCEHLFNDKRSQKNATRVVGEGSKKLNPWDKLRSRCEAILYSAPSTVHIHAHVITRVCMELLQKGSTRFCWKCLAPFSGLGYILVILGLYLGNSC